MLSLLSVVNDVAMPMTSVNLLVYSFQMLLCVYISVESNCTHCWGWYRSSKSGIGQTDDAALIHGIEIVRTVAAAVRALCFALDCLIKSHSKAHTSVGRRFENAMSLSHSLFSFYSLLTFRGV